MRSSALHSKIQEARKSEEAQEAPRLLALPPPAADSVPLGDRIREEKMLGLRRAKTIEDWKLELEELEAAKAELKKAKTVMKKNEIWNINEVS